MRTLRRNCLGAISLIAAPLAAITLAGGCSSAPSEDVGSTQAKIQSSEAVYFPPTKYDVTVTNVYVGQIINAVGTGGVEATPFVDWGGLGLSVLHTSGPPTTNYRGCKLGQITGVPGQDFTQCAEAGVTSILNGTDPSLSANALATSATIMNQGDTLQVAVVLDNIGSTNPATVGSAFVSTAASLGGNGLQVVAGGLSAAQATLPATAATTAAALGVAAGCVGAVGAGLAIAGILLAPQPKNVTGCNGGLMATPNPAFVEMLPSALGMPCQDDAPCGIPYPALDTQYLTFSALQLAELTALGPAEFTLQASVNWPANLQYDQPGACESSHVIQVSIARDINSGLAPSPKSPDFAVARLSDEIDVFRPFPHQTGAQQFAGIEQAKWNEAGWSSQKVFRRKFVHLILSVLEGAG